MDRGGLEASGRAVSRRHAQESGLGRAQGRSFTESRTCAAAAAAFPSSLRSLVRPLFCADDTRHRFMSAGAAAHAKVPTRG